MCLFLTAVFLKGCFLTIQCREKVVRKRTVWSRTNAFIKGYNCL